MQAAAKKEFLTSNTNDLRTVHNLLHNSYAQLSIYFLARMRQDEDAKIAKLA